MDVSAPMVDDACVISRQLFTEMHTNAQAFPDWDLDYTQLSSGEYRCIWQALNLPGLKIYVETGNALVHQCGSGKPGTFIFGFPIEMADNGIFNGSNWYRGIHGFRGEHEWDIVVPPMTLLMVEIDRQLLIDHAWNAEHIGIDRWLERDWLHLEDPAVCERVIADFDNIFRACFENPDSMKQAQSLRFIEYAVISALVPLIEAYLQPPKPSLKTFSRVQLVRKAREFILEHIDEPIQVIDVCRALGVSRRTLQSSYNEALGVNPVAYLRLLRLNGVRRDLRESPCAQTQVTEIAAKWGFWHLSRFSADYRQMFNERPSETLRTVI
jgi:AraC family ethanolamine operon transcriptional activator